jgi:hypothetical protein
MHVRHFRSFWKLPYKESITGVVCVGSERQIGLNRANKCVSVKQVCVG